MTELKNFLKKNEIDFINIEPYVLAFTHMSYINEKKMNVLESYERLEFLGDAVLQLITAKYLYENFESKLPGDMTILRSNIVNKSSLSSISRKLKLNKVLRLGKGEQRNKLPDSLLEDVLESLIGAIYVDLGFKAAERFINKNISYLINEISEESMKDYKTKLQEHLQVPKRSSIIYKTISEKKNKDDKTEFESEIIFEGITIGRGKGFSKKKSEQEAAKKAYDKLVV